MNDDPLNIIWLASYPKSGNTWKKLRTAQGSAQCLSKPEIIALAKLIVQIEKHYHFPVDVEWAKEKKKFFVTQSRPITTLG